MRLTPVLVIHGVCVTRQGVPVIHAVIVSHAVLMALRVVVALRVRVVGVIVGVVEGPALGVESRDVGPQPNRYPLPHVREVEGGAAVTRSERSADGRE